MRYQLRPLHSHDNARIAAIIRQVSAEFGLAAASGFAVADPILDDLYAVYQHAQHAYWVVVDDNDQVLGGGGCAPLHGAPEILEVQKMYFCPEVRGYGLATQILQQIFAFAAQNQQKICYLETTASLHQAVQLYQKLGFITLDAPLGQTGHSGACEIWMAKALTSTTSS